MAMMLLPLAKVPCAILIVCAGVAAVFARVAHDAVAW